MVGKDTVITCQHVFVEIDELREETNAEQYKVIYVLFPSHLQREIDEKKFPLYIGDKLDYTICYLKATPHFAMVSDPAPLGYRTGSLVPQSGRVILVGYPEGYDEKLQACQVIPIDIRVETLRERFQKAESFCHNNPGQCRRIIGQSSSCVHKYDELRLLEEVLSQELTYLSSFFHGASGSPLFNENGCIIAMHTGGYPYNIDLLTKSLMEFGIPIRAIYEDVKRQKGDLTAGNLFPNC